MTVEPVPTMFPGFDPTVPVLMSWTSDTDRRVLRSNNSTNTGPMRDGADALVRIMSAPLVECRARHHGRAQFGLPQWPGCVVGPNFTGYWWKNSSIWSRIGPA